MIALFMALALLLFVLFLGLPVAFTLGITSVMLMLQNSLPLGVVGTTVFNSVHSFVLVAVPLFILMSYVLLEGRVGHDLFDVMYTWVRHLHGGLAIGTVLATAFFCSITGSSAAAAATMGAVAYPAMTARGYDKKFTLGLLASAGTLGILLPPSIPMVIYGSITEESVGKLFIGGIIPGLIFTGILIVYVVYRSRTDKGASTVMPKASWKECLTITLKNAWGIALPFLMLGGIYSGAFTPTEAAAVGLSYSLFVTMIVYRTLPLRKLPDVCMKALATSCMIAMIIAGAKVFGRVMTMLEIPQTMTEVVIANNLSPFMFVIAMNLLMLVLGLFMETISVILLTVPLIVPLLHVLGIDPIWYGIIVTVNMTLALVTPPVGINLFVLCGLSKDIHIKEVIAGVMPFVFLMLLLLALVILFPALSTWLPSIM